MPIDDQRMYGQDRRIFLSLSQTVGGLRRRQRVTPWF